MNRLSALLSGARIILLLVGIGLVIWSTRLYPTLPITMSPSEADWAAIILGTGWSLTWWLFARRESFRLPVPQWLAVVPRWFTVTSTVAGGALASYRLLALWAGSTQVTIPQPGRLTAGLAILALTGAATCDATVKISGSNPGNPLKQILKPSAWLGGLASLLALALITGMMWQLTPKLIAATAAPGTELYPDLPQAVTGEVAWVKVLDGASFDGEPGLRGPHHRSKTRHHRPRCRRQHALGTPPHQPEDMRTEFKELERQRRKKLPIDQLRPPFRHGEFLLQRKR